MEYIKPNNSFRNRFNRPLSVYVNWAAYDELSDNVRLTEEIALEQFDEMIRLKKQGVKFDYYLMDCFWFAKEGGYRVWRKPDWPEHGPAKFLELCHKHDVKPGIWVSTNFLVAGEEYWFLDVIPEWKDSLASHGRSLCLFDGGYLSHFMQSLQLLVDQGFKMIKFDFADFGAATPAVEKTHTREDIRENNTRALLSAFKTFRYKNPDVLFLAYNGFGGDYSNTSTPINQSIDLRWMEVFDSLYCGDPRLSDIPFNNFWRSKDHYTDHMVRQYELNGVPLKNIDNCGFMIGNTGTCYHRGKSGWKAALLLSLARGGWMNTYYGDLKLLSVEDGEWFAKAQALFYPFQEYGRIITIGGLPGEGVIYGYLAENPLGKLITIINPKQEIAQIDLGMFGQAGKTDLRVLFSDEGFHPVLEGNQLQLGAEQMVILGAGKYAGDEFDLGKGDCNRIAKELVELKPDRVVSLGSNSFLADVTVPAHSNLLIFVQQFDLQSGLPYRSSGGGEPNGTRLNEIFRLSLSQNGKNIPFTEHYAKAIWSGLSWIGVEVEQEIFLQNTPIKISYANDEPAKANLSLYAVKH
jgi:hypothetical protein